MDDRDEGGSQSRKGVDLRAAKKVEEEVGTSSSSAAARLFPFSESASPSGINDSNGIEDVVVFRGCQTLLKGWRKMRARHHRPRRLIEFGAVSTLEME